MHAHVADLLWRLGEELQDAGLQEDVESLGGEEVLGLTQVHHAPQQCVAQHHKRHPLPHTAFLLLQGLSYLLQLYMGNSTLWTRQNISKIQYHFKYFSTAENNK